MSIDDVKECMLALESKKCEGFDRIPLCIIANAHDILLDPMADLFNKIYLTGAIPDQWKVSKITPIFKKGDRNQIENYRPIANLCSASKILEKLSFVLINLCNKNICQWYY